MVGGCGEGADLGEGSGRVGLEGGSAKTSRDLERLKKGQEFHSEIR